MCCFSRMAENRGRLQLGLKYHFLFPMINCIFRVCSTSWASSAVARLYFVPWVLTPSFHLFTAHFLTLWCSEFCGCSSENAVDQLHLRLTCNTVKWKSAFYLWFPTCIIFLPFLLLFILPHSFAKGKQTTTNYYFMNRSSIEICTSFHCAATTPGF